LATHTHHINALTAQLLNISMYWH